jgi:hypothetical protein
MLLVPAEITTVQISQSDITQLTVSNTDITTVSVQSSDITVLQNVSATINAASLSLSSDIPQDIARTGSSGTSSAVSRADHIHSIANTLLDGGNY